MVGARGIEPLTPSMSRKLWGFVHGSSALRQFAKAVHFQLISFADIFPGIFPFALSW
jgi:hypothetical protein